MRGDDVISLRDALVVDVIGPHARRVPVLTRYGAALAAAAFAGGGFVIGGRSGARRNVTTPLVSSLVAGPDAERLDVGRLRATWLCEVAHMIGLPTFMAAAGIACSQRLGDLVARAGALGDDDAVSLLGGPSC